MTNPKQAGIVLIDSQDSTIASNNLLQNGEEGVKKFKKRVTVDDTSSQESDSLPSSLFGTGRMARSEWVDKYDHQKIRRDKYRPK
jgi:parallel beta-helix repeat protein